MAKKNVEETPKVSVASRQLNAALTKLQEKYGPGSISLGNIPPIEWIRTGIYAYDWLSGGGLPRGRWSHIYGAKSSGKTTLCHIIEAIVQEQGGVAAHVDAEHSVDARYAEALGVDTSSLVYSKPRTQEETMSTVIELAGKVDFIAIDSIVAVPGGKEMRGFEKEGIEKDSMMVIPQKLSQFFRIVNPMISASRTAILLVNQTRMNLSGYQAFDDFAGGNALRHYNSVSLHIRQGAKKDAPTDEEGNVIGQSAVLRTEKNKVGGQPQGSSSSFNLYHTPPYVRPALDLAVMGIARGVISKDGKTYSFDGNKLAVGRDAAVEAIVASPELQEKLVKALEATSPVE